MVKVWSDIAWKDYCQLFDKHQQKLIKRLYQCGKDMYRKRNPKRIFTEKITGGNKHVSSGI